MRYKQTQQFNLMYNVSCETCLQMLEFNYSVVFFNNLVHHLLPLFPLGIVLYYKQNKKARLL